MKGQLTKVQEWSQNLLIWVSGLLLFETITGLSIYLLPFSVSNQFTVVLHTAIGLVMLIPFLWYQVRHFLIYRSIALNHIVLTGYFGMAATLVAIVSGVILTYQSVLGARISYGWDTVHIISTFALIAATVPHIFVIMRRDAKQTNEQAAQVVGAERKFIYKTIGITIALSVLIAIFTLGYQPVQLANDFPEDYNYLFGDERPFAPSLATTSTGGAYDPRSLGGSEGCGVSGCHEQIYQEWSLSAHRWSSMDPAFQAVQKVMAEQNGAESTRYCGGCHDPISLFSGTKNIFTEELTNLTGYQEGNSCIVCHAIKKTDIKGNANYVLEQPQRYVYEMKQGAAAQFVSNFLIRAYPKQHIASLQHRMFKSPEFCAACHKQFIDEEINKVGWVQLQNQYDNWRKSRWSHPGDPEKSIECRECHMPLQDSSDPASGDDLDYNRTARDGKHRSHRFLAANQFVPALLKLEGAGEHIELTEKWLQGKIKIPEIEHKWKTGPSVPIELVLPEKAVPGQDIKVQALLTNNKVGHDFPTGPLDIIQAWVELEVRDQDGNEVFMSGQRDERHFIKPGSFIFKAEAVDQYGNLIDRHNLWEMVGVRFRRAMFPGFSDKAEYTFACPGSGTPPAARSNPEQEFVVNIPSHKITKLDVKARLLYRKIDQYLLNFLLGEDSGITSPVTVMSEDRKTIDVVQAGN